LRRADFEASLSQMHKDSGLYLQALESNIRAVDLSLAGEVDPRNAAKLLCKRAEIYLRMNQPEECRRVIDDAYKMLLGTQFSSPPSKQAIYLENTFVDLFTIDIELRQELYKKDPTAEQLEEIWYLYDQAIRVNEALNDQHLFSVCKFLSSANTDAIAERGIAFGLEILKKDKSDEVLSKIAALSHMSRNLVLDEKLSFNQSYFELKSLPAAKIDSLSTMYTYLSTQANTEAKRLEIKNEINSLVPREPQYESHLSTATLEYIRAAGDYYLFAEIENQPSIIHIGAVSDIYRLVETVRAELLGRKDILNSTHLRKLSEILLPVEISLPRQISIVADGDLSVFPFGIIYRNGKYLIQDHDILYAPRPKRSDRVAVKNILCYAPAYKSGDGVVALERSENGQLIHAATEVEVIASMLGSGVTVRKNDSFGRLVDQIRAVDVFHFAGHAAFDTSTAAIYIETVDGVDHWDFDNIFQYVFDLELVTVSACESGIGTYSNGDGAQSIARGFMGAGARSVAYSLWKVNDQSTVQIMTDFYKNLKAGQPKDVALSSAQRHFLETSSPQLRHPYYWAAFVIAGDPSSIVVKNRGVGPYLLGAAGILIILLITRKTIQQ